MLMPINSTEALMEIDSQYARPFRQVLMNWQLAEIVWSCEIGRLIVQAVSEVIDQCSSSSTSGNDDTREDLPLS